MERLQRRERPIGIGNDSNPIFRIDQDRVRGIRGTGCNRRAGDVPQLPRLI